MQQNVFKLQQYPAQTGIYKVLVKDKPVWQLYNTARLQISVGNPKHEGEKFRALANWAAGRFNKTIVIVSDTLQRHNIACQNNLGPITAYDLSLSMGDKWISDNDAALKAIPNLILTRWNDWINDAEYQSAYEHLMGLYKNELALSYIIGEKAAEFNARSNRNFANSKMLEVSKIYILEEIAAFYLMFKRDRAVDIYPGPWFQEIFDIISILDTSEFGAVFKDSDCLRVDFGKNKSFKPLSIAA